MASSWISYNELAWTEDFFADQADYEDEVKVYVDLLRGFSENPPRTLLHMGCGAGGHDSILKRHFTVTGVDISRGMLEKARITNPEIEYIEDDMRTVRLNRQFDAVAIPDSIDYMVTREDLLSAVQTASEHLKPGGTLLIAAKPEEIFRNNNFAYTGERDGVQVTLLENNYINPFSPHTYEITLIYLIRRQGKLSVYTETTTAGLFPRSVWLKVLEDAGFTVRESALNGLYDKYLLEGGMYPMVIFMGKLLRNRAQGLQTL